MGEAHLSMGESTGAADPDQAVSMRMGGPGCPLGKTTACLLTTFTFLVALLSVAERWGLTSSLSLAVSLSVSAEFCCPPSVPLAVPW